MMSDRNVLIFSFYFPPSNRIGGRRWSFFIKNLIKNGIKVYVIASDFDDSTEGDCPWGNQLGKLNEDNVYRLKHRTPSIILEDNPSTIKGKLSYKKSKWISEHRTNSNIYDRSLNWKKEALQKAKELIKKHEINTIIASGDPFGYLVDVVNEFEKEKVYCDLRDPWGYGSNFESRLKAFSEERAIAMREEVDQVFDKSEGIFVPVVEMERVYKSRYQQHSKKIHLLPHGYDEEIVMNHKGHDMSAFFAGSLFPHLESNFQVLKVLSNYLNIDIYAINKTEYQSEFGEFVNFKKVVSQNVLFENTKHFKFAIILLNSECKDYFSSKFYELLALGKTLIYVGESGKVSEFILQNGLGYHFDENRISDFNFSLLNQDLLQDNSSLYVDYSFKEITKQLISIIE